MRFLNLCWRELRPVSAGFESFFLCQSDWRLNRQNRLILHFQSGKINTFFFVLSWQVFLAEIQWKVSPLAIGRIPPFISWCNQFGTTKVCLNMCRCVTRQQLIYLYESSLFLQNQMRRYWCGQSTASWLYSGCKATYNFYFKKFYLYILDNNYGHTIWNTISHERLIYEQANAVYTM